MLPGLPWFPSACTMAHGLFFSPSIPPPRAGSLGAGFQLPVLVSHLKTLAYAVSFDSSTLENINLFLKHRGSLSHPPEVSHPTPWFPTITTGALFLP